MSMLCATLTGAAVIVGISIMALLACSGIIRDSEDASRSCDPSPSIGEPAADDEVTK